MKLFDLHCDTLLCAYHKGCGLTKTGLQIDLDRAGVFTEYGQVLAIFSEHALSGEECYAQFDRVVDHFERIAPHLPPSFVPILAVEGGKLLEGEASRLRHLYERGVRILTLVWGEVSCMGGAFHTDIGLTPFGRSIVEECFDLGILPDLSHASLPMIEQTIAMGEAQRKTVIASHSNFRALCDHPRNLTDDHARRIASLGGVIGISLVRPHLSVDERVCSIDTVVDHILYGVDLCGREAIGLGCDLDGTDRLPDGLEGVGDLPLLYQRLADRAHSQDLADSVFYQNTRDLLSRSLPRR